MKTFTITFHHSHNYGAVLQAYALQQAIYKLGHENTIFEYPYSEGYYSKLKDRNPKAFLKNFLRNVLKFFRKKVLKRLDDEFTRFHNERMVLSRTYLNMQDLKDNYPIADCYVTGSDQVWNLNTSPNLIPARFLDFGDENIKRISYAASIERLDYNEEACNRVREYLKKFSAVSLREQSACDYIADKTGVNGVRVLDPIFLLEKSDWEELAVDPRIKGKYILCYQVQRNSKIHEVANKIKKITGYKIISICNSEVKYFNADYSFFDVSPEEFIGFYLNAEVVISASFHGTAFGILFQKPTYGLTKSQGTTRIKEILELFEMQEYCISESSFIPAIKKDFSRQIEILERERQRSMDYLKVQFENEN